MDIVHTLELDRSKHLYRLGNSHASKAAAPAKTSASWRSGEVGKPGGSDRVLVPLTSDSP